MSLAVGTKLGPYEITGSLGSGGMGQVYQARDTRLDRDVAVKVLPDHLTSDGTALARFRRETRAVAALSHPNILALYDIGEDRGVAYAVTELLVGETLRERVRRGPVSPEKAMEFARSILDGLAAAHDKGIVHRDLKPENVFVTAEGHVKILDFGLAKNAGLRSEGEPQVTRTQHTLPGSVLGTVGYMSPEQVRGEEVDHRSDIFSFGALLYEMLTGRRAFSGRSDADTISAILKEEPAELARDAESVPAGIARVLIRCLAKEPDGRYPSARELRVILETMPKPDS